MTQSPTLNPTMLDPLNTTLLSNDHDCDVIPVFSPSIEEYLLTSPAIPQGHYKFSCVFGKVRRGDKLVLVCREIQIRQAGEIVNPNQQELGL